MEFSVTTITQRLIAPSGPTPSGLLELSGIDRLPVLRCNARTLHVFRHGPGAAQVIGKALSEALVPYYPLAGRIHVSAHNELQIACSGEGVWFVEATTDCTLNAVNYFDDAMTIPHDKLLPVSPKENDGLDDPLVQMQVTQFKCGGFVIGLIFCHSLCDGLGAAQFLKAVGEFAKGAEQLSINPKWCRDFFPPPNPNNPLTITTPMHITPDYQLQHATIDISLDRIKDLKREFHESYNSNGAICSTFEIVAALLWRQRTRAINLKDSDSQVKLVFFANCRHLISLPVGFYGNCFFPVTVTAAAVTVASSSVFRVVKMIQEAKAGLPGQFAEWISDAGTDTGKDPFAPPLEYTTLFISEWGRLGFNQVDYGWGNPAHVVPIQGSSIIPVGIVCTQPYPKVGVRLMTWCVQQTHLQTLLHQITILTN